jgi:hypothetical protein
MTTLQCRLFSCFYISFNIHKSDFCKANNYFLYAPFYEIVLTCLTLNVILYVLYVPGNDMHFIDTISRRRIYLLLCTMQSLKIASNIFIQYCRIFIIYQVKFESQKSRVFLTVSGANSHHLLRPGVFPRGQERNHSRGSQPPVTSVSRF